MLLLIASFNKQVKSLLDINKCLATHNTYCPIFGFANDFRNNKRSLEFAKGLLIKKSGK